MTAPSEPPAGDPSLQVVHLFKTYPPVRGGIEGHIDLLTALLARRGVRPGVLCTGPSGTAREEARGGVAIHRVAAGPTVARGGGASASRVLAIQRETRATALHPIGQLHGVSICRQ